MAESGLAFANAGTRSRTEGQRKRCSETQNVEVNTFRVVNRIQQTFILQRACVRQNFKLET